MSQYQKILFIPGPSRDRTAGFRRALHLARTTGAVLHLVMFDHHAGIAAVGMVSDEVRDLARRAFVEERERWLHELANDARAQGVRVRTAFVWGTPIHERIVDKVDAVDPDLVVKDVQVESIARRILLTPLDWHLIRSCPAPLLLVNREAEALPRRIIAAVDPAHPWNSAGALNDRIVATALGLAVQCDAQIELLHVFEGLPPSPTPEGLESGVYLAEAYDALRKLHRDRFAEFATHYGVPPEHKHFVDGSPAMAIADFAVDSAGDVLVLGALQRTGVDRLLVGSTAERVLDYLHSDVLVVKPEGFREHVAHALHDRRAAALVRAETRSAAS